MSFSIDQYKYDSLVNAANNGGAKIKINY